MALSRLSATIRVAGLSTLMASLFLVFAGGVQAEEMDGGAAAEAGDRLMAAGDYVDAAEKFQRAYQADGNPDMLYQLGQAFERAGDLGNAVVAYRRYLDEGFDEDTLSDAKERMDRYLAELSQTSTEYRIMTVPIEVKIFLDDKQLGVAPNSFWLPFGRHQLRFELEDYFSESRTIEVKQGEPDRILVELRESGETGWLTFEGEFEDVTLTVDGSEVTQEELELPVAVSAGSRRVKAIKPDFMAFEAELDVAAGETVNVGVKLIPEGAAGFVEGGELAIAGVVHAKKKFPVASWVSLGVGAAAFALGGTFSLDTANKVQQVEDYDRTAPGASLQWENQLIHEAQTAAVRANVFLGAAGVALVTAGVLYLLN